MADFNVGYTTIGAAAASVTANWFGSNGTANATTGLTMPQTGLIKSLSVYISSGAGCTGIVGIYDNTGASGAPGQLIASTNQGSPATFSPTGWVTVNTTTNPQVNAGAQIYIFSTFSVTNGVSQNYDTGISGYEQIYNTAGGSFALPSTAPTMTDGGAGTVYSQYATFSPPPDNPPPDNPPFGLQRPLAWMYDS